MTRQRPVSFVVIVALLVLSVIAIGCEEGTGPAPTFVFPTTFRTAQPTSGPDTSHVEQLIATVGGTVATPGLLNEFWTEALGDLTSTVGYRSPVTVTSYLPDHPIDTACAGDESGSNWNQNAYYCPLDETISWEREWFSDMASAIGNLAPVAVLAHEWGHHIQKLTQSPDAKIASENQADCYSGAFFRRADDAGWLAAYFAGEDARDAVATIYLLGNADFVASQWYSTYGPPRSRQLAFGLGGLGVSPAVCALYQTYEYRDPLQLGWYTLDPPASFSVTDHEGVQVLSHGDVNAEVKVLPTLGDMPAALLFDEVAAQWFASSDFEWTNEVFADPFTARLGGSSAIRSYEQRLTDANGTTRTVHGDVVLQADAGQGGLLFDVYLPGPAATTGAEQDLLTQWAAIVANGLCPGGVGTLICPTVGVR